MTIDALEYPKAQEGINVHIYGSAVLYRCTVWYVGKCVVLCLGAAASVQKILDMHVELDSALTCCCSSCMCVLHCLSVDMAVKQEELYVGCDPPSAANSMCHTYVNSKCKAHAMSE